MTTPPMTAAGVTDLLAALYAALRASMPAPRTIEGHTAPPIPFVLPWCVPFAIRPEGDEGLLPPLLGVTTSVEPVDRSGMVRWGLNLSAPMPRKDPNAGQPPTLTFSPIGDSPLTAGRLQVALWDGWTSPLSQRYRPGPEGASKTSTAVLTARAYAAQLDDLGDDATRQTRRESSALTSFADALEERLPTLVGRWLPAALATIEKHQQRPNRTGPRRVPVQLRT